MAKTVRLRFNQRNGFRGLRTAPGVVADIERRAKAVAAAAGEGVEVLPVVQEPYSRAHAVVAATTPEAKRRIGQDPAALLRALEAGRE